MQWNPSEDHVPSTWKMGHIPPGEPSRFARPGTLIRTLPDHETPIWSSLGPDATVLLTSRGDLCLVLATPHEVVMRYAVSHPGVHINPNHYLVFTGGTAGYLWVGMALFLEETEE